MRGLVLPARPANTPVRPVVAARLLVLVFVLVPGAPALVPLRAAPLADQAALPHAADIPPSAAGGGTLDRTLQVDTDAAQRNLELLLETRGEGDPLQAPTARRQMPAAPAGAASAGAWPGDPQAQPASRPDEGRAAARWILGQVAPVLREHRLSLLVALGLVAVAVAGLQLWRRLRAGAEARRLRALAAQQRMPRGRRRSSRR